jgi:hypothetical protein
MFLCFSVAAGKDRFGEQIKLAGKPRDCKVSARGTNGAMCVFELTGAGAGPRHGRVDVPPAARARVGVCQRAPGLGKYSGGPHVHEALRFDEFKRLFPDHGMDLAGPPLIGEWKVEEDERVTQIA